MLVAYGSISSNEVGKTIASAVCAAIPQNKNDVGIIMEYSGFCSAKEAEENVRRMAQISMDNHGIRYRELCSSAIEKTVEDSDYVTVISAISMW